MSSILKVDQLQDSGGNNLVTSNGSGVITSSAFGKILQVVSVVDSTDVTVNNQTYTDTGLTANITPSSTSSKVLITVNTAILVSGTGAAYAGIKLLRGSTDIFNPMATNSNGPFGHGFNSSAGGLYGFHTMQFLDSPNSTAQQSYKTQFRNYHSTGSMYAQVNVGSTNNDGKSVMTLMEVLA